MAAQPTHPPRHLPGTNLTLSEIIRLVFFLCVLPWAVTTILVATRILSLPSETLSWLTILGSPLVWAPVISAIADGRTLLGRPKEPESPKQLLWNIIRAPVYTRIIGRDPKTAQDQTARTGLALAAVYTGLMTLQPVRATAPGYSHEDNIITLHPGLHWPSGRTPTISSS